jgi:hypothetical protein
LIDPTVDAANAVTWGSDKIQKLEQSRNSRERMWKRSTEAYLGEFGDSWKNLKKIRSKRFFNVSMHAVESVAAQMIESIIPHDQFMDLLGITPDDDAGAKMMRSLMFWQLEKTNFKRKAELALKDAVLLGSVPWSVTHTVKKVRVPDQEIIKATLKAYEASAQQAQEQGMPPPPFNLSLENKDLLVYDGPEFNYASILDFYMDRKADDSDYAVRVLRFKKTLAWLLSNNLLPDGRVKYENLAEVQEGPVENRSVDGLKRTFDQLRGFTEPIEDGVELHEFWGDFPIRDSEGNVKIYKNYKMVLANRRVLLAFEPNGFMHGMCPWQLFTFIEEPGEVYGRGLLEPYLGFQDAINVRFNQCIDANTMSIAPPMGYVDDGLFDPDDMDEGPGTWHPFASTAGPSSIWPLYRPNDAALGMGDMGFLLTQFNDLSGANKAFTNADNKKSATEVNVLSQTASALTNRRVKHCEEQFLFPAMRMWIAVNQQFMDTPMWVRITANQATGMPSDIMTKLEIEQGSDTVRMIVKPEDIAGAYDLRIVGSSQVSQNQQQYSQQLQLSQIMLSDPEIRQEFKLRPWLERLLENGGFRDAGQYLKTAMEKYIEQQQQFYQQLALAQAGGQAGMAGAPGQGGPPPSGGEPGPGGPPSMAGVSEAGDLPVGGPDPSQLSGPTGNAGF